MSRELLVWQIADLIGTYALDRLWRSIHEPLWVAYELALATDDWDDYRALYAELPVALAS